MIDLTKLHKSSAPIPYKDTDKLVLIIQLKDINIIPKHLELRSHIAGNIITGNILGVHLKELEQDPNVQSITISTKMPLL